MKHILNKIVQVFFLLGQPSYWNPAEPNWFYYWKQFVDKGKIKSIVFNDKDNNFASTSRVDNSFVTTIRQEASEHNWVTNHDGIHTFVETLIHENKHIEIWNNWWPNGYDSTIDSDHDYVPDEWERTIGIQFKFCYPTIRWVRSWRKCGN